MFKIEFALHGPFSHGGDFGFFAGVGGQHFDDFTSDEGGVAVEADEAFGAANQAGAFDGDIDLEFPGELRERFA